MPVKAKTNGVKRDGTKFNPSVGHGFTNDKFGKDAILVKIDVEGLKAVSENLQVGSTLLLKFNKVTSQGNKHYFCEILPPYTPPKTTDKTPVATGDLD